MNISIARLYSFINATLDNGMAIPSFRDRDTLHGIVSKQLNKSSKFFHHRMAP